MRQSESLCRKTQEKRIRKRNKKKKKIYIIKFESKQQVHESIKAVRIQEKKKQSQKKGSNESQPQRIASVEITLVFPTLCTSKIST